MDASNDIMIRISPNEGKITVEEDAQGVFSRKSITEEDLLRCFKDSLRTADEGYHSGFLPLNTISLYQSETVKRFVLWHPRLYADVSVYDTPYPHFPIPRLVFGFSLNQEGKASHCRIGVVADEIPTPETPMYYYPFSNVSRESGSLCVGANTLPIYKKPHKAHNLPAFLLSIPNNMVYIQGQIDLHASQQKEQAQELMEAQVRHTQLQERIGELERKRTTGFDGNSMIDRLADLYARYEELQRENPVIADTANLDLQIHAAAEKLARRKADAYQSKYAAALAQAQERIHRLSMEFKRTKHIHDGLTAGGQCPMCRQTITEQTLPQVKGEFAASLRRIQAEGCQLTAQCKEVQELDAKARTVFEQFREDDIAAGEAELEELSGQRKQALEQAEERRNFHQQELERLHSEIQSTELDRECGMLSQEEIEELNRARTEFAGLNAKIEVLSKLVQASPEAAGKQEQDIKQMQASIQQKKELLSALAFYISKRVEINFSKLRMNRVSITLYDVVKSTGEVKDVFRFTYEGRDYICLSHSERIRAGLEVAELIKRLLGVEYPTFIDDVESVPVIDNVRPTGQVFIAKVIKGTALQVQVADNTGVPKAA